MPAPLRLDLACSLASLRCRMYGIAPSAVGRRDLRLFDRRGAQRGLPGATAGCPCPAPVADVLAGLVSVFVYLTKKQNEEDLASVFLYITIFEGTTCKIILSVKYG